MLSFGRIILAARSGDCKRPEPRNSLEEDRRSQGSWKSRLWNPGRTLGCMRSPTMLDSGDDAGGGIMLTSGANRRFQLVLIKPSHYDDEGYVIRWWRAMIPSNSLAAVYGIAADCAERRGPRSRSRNRHPRDRRDQHARRRAGAPRPLPASRRFRACCAGRRSVQPVSPRPRHRAAVPGSRDSRRHGRVPRVGLPVDAGRARGRPRRLPGAGHRDVRGRSRGPPRHGPARCGRGPSRAAVQLHEGSARDGEHARPVPPQAPCGPHARA